jgi:hypothetical protein
MTERSEERRHKMEAERFRRLSSHCADPKVKLKLRQIAAMHGGLRLKQVEPHRAALGGWTGTKLVLQVDVTRVRQRAT